MRVRRRPRIVLCTAAVVAASGLALVDAAGAAPGVPAAPAVPVQSGAPRVCIEPTIRFGEAPDAPSVVTRTIPGGLPAGRYRVSVTTSDGYAGRTETAFDIETSERVTVYGQVTQDLADGVESDTKTLTFEVSFNEPQTTVVVAHTPANGPDSVRVDQLCWERLGDLEVSTTTTAAPPTTAPAAGGGTTTTLPGLVLQTVPGLVFLDGGTTTTTAGACTASGGAGAGSGAGSGGAGSTTGGATAASTCPVSTVLASQLPLAPTANAVTSAPAFTG